MTEFRENNILFPECVVAVYRRDGNGRLHFAGTGFRLFRPGLVVTANHFVAGHGHYELAISAQKVTANQVLLDPVVSDVEEVLTPHPTGSYDVAVLRLKDVEGDWQTFELDRTVDPNALGASVASYGYPAATDPKKIADARLLEQEAWLQAETGVDYY